MSLVLVMSGFDYTVNYKIDDVECIVDSDNDTYNSWGIRDTMMLQ